MRQIILLILALFLSLATQCAPMISRDYWDVPPEISDYGVWDIAVDGSGNVYITGTIEDGQTGTNYVVVKYDASGKELWSRIYNGPANREDYASAMALDDLGNVYVTGCSMGTLHRIAGHDEPTYDYATMKYDKDGNQLWVARYDAFYEDLAADMAVDHAGNVYITGISDPPHGGTNYVTVKYDTDGNELWVARYDGPDKGADEPSAVAVDDYGNAYVTGSARSDDQYVFATIKYDNNGNQLWVVLYGRPGSWLNKATDVAVDEVGNAHVTGWSSGSKQSDKLVTIKYGKDGNELWESVYQGSTRYGRAQIALDAQKNVYITVTSQIYDYNSDFLTIKYNNMGQEEWVATHGGVCGSQDEVSAIAADSEGNIYITGSETHGLRMARFFNWPEKIRPREDFVTIKYDAGGKKQWTAKVSGNGGGGNWGKAITVDDVGNVYVTGNGHRYVDWRTAGTVPSSWFTTIKYNANGEQQYLTRF